MKTSVRLYKKARSFALQSSFFFVLSCALAIWALVAGMNQSMLMLPLFLAAGFSIALSLTLASDCARTMSQASREEADEWRRAIRPRL